MANLYKLVHDEKYADEMAYKFADLVEQNVDVPEDKNTEINFTNELIEMFERAGKQSSESYSKFYSIKKWVAYCNLDNFDSIYL